MDLPANERWERVKDLVADALERVGAERAQFLDEACGGDAALRGEVDRLLTSFEGAGDDEFLGNVDEAAKWRERVK